MKIQTLEENPDRLAYLTCSDFHPETASEFLQISLNKFRNNECSSLELANADYFGD